MAKNIILLPNPREIMNGTGTFKLPKAALITIPDGSLLFEGKTAQDALQKHTGYTWEIVAGSGYPNVGLTLKVDPALSKPQGYQLEISSSAITIIGEDAAGVYYGVLTLSQILQQAGAELPILTIKDYPDFTARGVMLDMSRDRVMKMETLYRLIDRLASWKINEIQLYIEHTFAYRNHPDVWAAASPFTGQEILEIDAYCRQRHIDLVPNQNSLGHMERWLKFPQYNVLAECPDGFQAPWSENDVRPASTLNPLDPGSLELVISMYDELLPHFSSKLFNVGGDEPWELGQGKSKEEIEKRGGRVYFEWLLKLQKEAKRHGRTMQFWADIIVKYPDLVPELPKDMIAMVWGYEGHHPDEKECELVSKAGLPFYVCPGTSSWNTIIGRTENTMENLKTAARNGHKYGAIGYLNTDWGDNGHWQPLAVSLLGFAYGAGISWCYETNESIALIQALDLFAFEDEAGVMGKLAFDLGNVYQLAGPPHSNSQALATLMQRSPERIPRSIEFMSKAPGAVPLTLESMHEVISRIDEIMQPINTHQMQCEDASILTDEFKQGAGLIRHSANRMLLYLGEEGADAAELLPELEALVSRQQQVWLTSHRPGGLKDSVARFDDALNGYRSPEKA